MTSQNRNNITAADKFKVATTSTSTRKIKKDSVILESLYVIAIFLILFFLFFPEIARKTFYLIKRRWNNRNPSNSALPSTNATELGAYR